MLFLFFSWFTGGRPPWDTQQNMVLHLSLLSNLNQLASQLCKGRCLCLCFEQYKIIGNESVPPLIEYQSKSLVRKKCILVLFTASQDQHCRLQIVLVAFSSWFPGRGIWLSSRLGEMKSHVGGRGRRKCLNMLPLRWRKDGRFSTFYGFNETIGGSEANY